VSKAKASPGPGRRRRPAPAGGKPSKQRVLNRDRSALVQSIPDAVVIKDEEIFFLGQPNGQVPQKGNHGLGLYYHDCRFLNRYEFRVAGVEPTGLIAAAASGFEADLRLANPDVRLEDGRLLQKEDLGIGLERVIDASRNTLYDRITFENYQQEAVEFPVTLSFGSAFEDVFAVRGMPSKGRGKLHPPRWEGGALSFLYECSDGIDRSLAVYFSPLPETGGGATVKFRVRLEARASKSLLVRLVLAESSGQDRGECPEPPAADFQSVTGSLNRSGAQWLEGQTEVKSDSLLLDRVLGRALRYLRVLRSSLRDHTYFAAGVPWFVALFGRDSLIACLQTLAYGTDVAENTLRLLASYQGTKVDDWRDEQPGKILHELRVGEMARTDEIPQTPYYGSIDATPLFLILISRHAAWTGSLALFEELRGPVEKALAWMTEYGDLKKNDYLAYQVKSRKGLGNQGWKDSGDAIVNADGSLAEPPIALAEVQGYAYLARVGVADLFRRAGEPDRARQLQQEADDLRQRFNRDYWLEDLGVYALALQAGMRPAAVVSSNAGQVLWSGIADPDKARRTTERLTADDVFNGWGVRTLSAKERRYNPVGYHLGTVWPHDNSLVLSGFRRYGFDEATRRVFTGIVEAATRFHADRLPEVFAGYPREPFGVPVHYPVACHPQAWAAGAVPFMTEALLGLVPEGFERRLRVVRPVLPDFVDRLEVRRLRVGPGRADLRFQRTGAGEVGVTILNVSGPLDVVIEQQGAAP
jgi:glycogen debranching enzyme